MTPDAVLRAAGLLLAARRDLSPIDSLPDDCRPRTQAEAYAIQAAVVAHLTKELGGPDGIAGFKIGATSVAAQEFLGLDGPFYGCIPRDKVLASPARVAPGEHNFCLIEPEFAVRLGQDLPARETAYGRGEVAEAVASVHPAFEVVTSAYGAAWRQAGALHLIADNGVHNRLVLGPGRDDWRGLDLAAHPVVFTRNGEEEGRGVGANALGHPLDALAWLASQGVSGGRGLRAGDLVTTGVVTPFIVAGPGDDLVADFGVLGQVDLRMTG
jgi:2-keto-4-pentenoate hydratase